MARTIKLRWYEVAYKIDTDALAIRYNSMAEAKACFAVVLERDGRAVLSEVRVEGTAAEIGNALDCHDPEATGPKRTILIEAARNEDGSITETVTRTARGAK